MDCIVHGGHKELHMTEWLSLPCHRLATIQESRWKREVESTYRHTWENANKGVPCLNMWWWYAISETIQPVKWRPDPFLREVRKEWVTREMARAMRRLSCAPPQVPPKASLRIPVKDPLWLHHAVDHMGHVVLGRDHFRGRVVFIHSWDLFQN